MGLVVGLAQASFFGMSWLKEMKERKKLAKWIEASCTFPNSMVFLLSQESQWKNLIQIQLNI